MKKHQYMRRLVGFLFMIALFSFPVFAIELNLNKDTPNTELVVTDKGFGYKTTITSKDGNIILNIPSNIEIISKSIEPIKVEEKSTSFLIFTLYQGQTLYFKNTANLEIVFRYPEGYGQFSTNLYDSIKSMYS